MPISTDQTHKKKTHTNIICKKNKKVLKLKFNKLIEQ